MRGLVTKSTGSQYTVRTEIGPLLCYIKGNLRLKGIRTTNPVAVGDWVEVAQQPDGTNWIKAIEPRRNYIIRRATNLSKEAQVLAANLDQVLLLVTLHHPDTNLVFIDRFLATAEAYRVPVVIVFNKIDLLTEKDMEVAYQLRTMYEALRYLTLLVSAKNPASLTDLRELLKGKTTLLAGNSGVGKSTLLNSLFGKIVTRTGLISDAHDKGMHTTTFSEMYDLPFEGEQGAANIIDIPGIKGFGSVEMDKYEVSHYFREIFTIGQGCRYSDCLHMGEPGCAVHDAVVDGRITISRYESYISILGDCSESKYR